MGTQATTSLDPQTRRQEVLGILALSSTVLTGLSLWSYDGTGGENLIGPVGHATADLLIVAFGMAACLIPAELGLMALRLFAGRRSPLGIAHLSTTSVFVLVGCALLHLGAPDVLVFGDHLPGGMLGEVLGELLRSLFGLTGALVVGVSLVMVTFSLRAPFSLLQLVRKHLGVLATRLGSTGRGVREAIAALLDSVRDAKMFTGREGGVSRRAREPKVRAARATDKKARSSKSNHEETGAEVIQDHRDDEFDDDDDLFEVDDFFDPDELLAQDELLDDDSAPASRPRKPGKKQAPARTSVAAAATQPATDAGTQGPKIVAPVEDGQPQPATCVLQERPRKATPAARHFQMPSTTLLDPAVQSGIEIDHKTLKIKAARLVEKLEAYGVHGRVDEIHPGPVVTMYEFEPKSGTKVSKMAGLADDLAMSLAAQKVRIVAPIPGKARVGFELPNANRQVVAMRQILEDERWEQQQGPLPIALGKDIAGHPVYGDLSKMPHLLVAGATGAGKSVGLNVMLASLLFKRSPEEVRLLMIDPKVVELAVYDGIPHMLLPVVTDMNKASLALRWAVDEMERRYQLFADAGARNVSTYNQRVDKVRCGEMSIAKLWPSKAGKVRTTGVNGEEIWVRPDGDEQPDTPDPPERLPYIVVVVDEFADLMMVAAKDVEASIARLAQKARAAGIHVILATQRPSVDVITGMIKANFPARIAFKVSQREDSKTILGRQGAEHLLGMGDMLMIPPGASDLKRVHSAYISEDEVRQLCEFLRNQGAPIYDENILKPRDDDDGGSPGLPKSDDPMYDRAVATVASAGYCSISHLQRQLSVGYNKAAKLVESMEREGVVGPPSGKAGGRREVLIQSL